MYYIVYIFSMAGMVCDLTIIQYWHDDAWHGN